MAIGCGISISFSKAKVNYVNLTCKYKNEKSIYSITNNQRSIGKTNLTKKEDITQPSPDLLYDQDP